MNNSHLYNLITKDDLEQARQKALRLLEDNLNPAQKHQLHSYHSFRVTSSKGRKYTIDCTSIVTNISRREDDDYTAYRFCLYIQDGVIPRADTFLAQKLLIESDEDYFLHLATRYKISRNNITSLLSLHCEYVGTPYCKKLIDMPAEVAINIRWEPL
jgi:hypothetical protein